MSTQTTLTILIGHKITDKLAIDDIPEENDFHNFPRYHNQNMDGNLKFLVGDNYTFLGLPLSITYLDDGENLNPYAIPTKEPAILETVTTQIKELNQKLDLKITPDIKFYILMHET